MFLGVAGSPIEFLYLSCARFAYAIPSCSEFDPLEGRFQVMEELTLEIRFSLGR